MRTILTIMWKEFEHIKADKLMVRLIFAPVLIQLYVIGYALTTEVKNTPIAILDWSGSVQSQSLISVIRHNPLFDYGGIVGSEIEMRQKIDNGAIKVGLIIPSDFAARLTQPGGASLQMLADGQDANSSAVATGYVSAIVQKWITGYLKNDLAKRGVAIASIIPVTVSPVVLFNPLLKSTWYMIPGLVVILVAMITGLLTGFSIVKEKERGTFEQLMVTPIKPFAVLMGKVFTFVLIGLLEIGMFLPIAIAWFRLPFCGSVFTLLAFALVYMTSSLGIGILASSIARTSQQVLFLLFFILIFFILLSGFFIPVENMPHWVQIVTYANPVRFFMFVVRAIFLKGAGFADLWREGLIMLGIGIVFFSISVITFQRKAG